MKLTNSNSYVSKSLQKFKDGQYYMDIFRNNNKVLDDIQKSLELYLDKKRTAFPRFYFLSNDELITILAEASVNPDCVQPHLRKIFENIARIDIENESISRIISAEKEGIRLIKNIKVGSQNNPVEEWLNRL